MFRTLARLISTCSYRHVQNRKIGGAFVCLFHATSELCEGYKCFSLTVHLLCSASRHLLLNSALSPIWIIPSSAKLSSVRGLTVSTHTWARVRRKNFVLYRREIHLSYCIRTFSLLNFSITDSGKPSSSRILATCTIKRRKNQAAVTNP